MLKNKQMQEVNGVLNDVEKKKPLDVLIVKSIPVNHEGRHPIDWLNESGYFGVSQIESARLFMDEILLRKHYGPKDRIVKIFKVSYEEIN